MKRMSLALLTIFALLLSTSEMANASTAPSCATIKTINSSSKKGISLRCLDGIGSVRYESIRGPVLVNVWGSWCEPCKQEIPLLVGIAATKKISIVGIDVEERNMKAGRDFVAAHKMSWPQLYDERASTRGIFGMGVPVTWFIDGEGKVLFKQIGLFKSSAQIKQLVDKYFGIKI